MLFFRGRDIAASAACVIGLCAMAFGVGAAAEPIPDSSAPPPLLNDAFNAFLRDQGRWAYTEIDTIIGLDGKALGESSYRLDPSAPYAEQFKPLKIRGKPPTQKQMKEAADRGEREGKRRIEKQQKMAQVVEDEPQRHQAEDVHLRVGGQLVTPQIDRAKVVQEDEKSVTYEVPMHPDGKGNAEAILDKFELTARVGKETHQFELVTIRQRASLRVKLIAKISDSVLHIEFSTPDPRYSAVPTKIIAEGNLKLLFGKERAMHSEAMRSEWKHVTPYDERFGVKLGPTRTIEL